MKTRKVTDFFQRWNREQCRYNSAVFIDMEIGPRIRNGVYLMKVGNFVGTLWKNGSRWSARVVVDGELVRIGPYRHANMFSALYDLVYFNLEVFEKYGRATREIEVAQ